MWINWHCKSRQAYHIKIYVGGVNAISGEPAVENAATRLRQQEKLRQGVRALQDYVTVPGQRWLDGIADSNGTVRQFVATPFGSGQSVETQITGEEVTGGTQFEVTPYKAPTPPAPYHIRPRPGPLTSYANWGSKNKKIGKYGDLPIEIATNLGTVMEMWVRQDQTVEVVKDQIQVETDIPSSQQRLIFGGKLLVGSYVCSSSVALADT